MLSSSLSNSITGGITHRVSGGVRLPPLTPEQFAEQLRAAGQLRLWDYEAAVRYRNRISRKIRFFPDTGRFTSPNGAEANPDPLFTNTSVWVPSHGNSAAAGTVLNGNGTCSINSNNGATLEGRIPTTEVKFYIAEIPILSVGNGTVTINTTNSVGIGLSSETFSVAGTQYFPIFTYATTNFRIFMSSTAAQATPATIGTISVKEWSGVHWVQETNARRPTATKHGWIYDSANTQWMWGRYLPTGLMGTDPNGTVLVYGTSTAGTILQIVLDGDEAGNHMNLMVQNDGGGGTIFANSTIGGNHRSGESANNTNVAGRTQLSENAGISGQQNKTYRDGVQVAKQPGTTDNRWTDKAALARFSATYSGMSKNAGGGYLNGTFLRIAAVSGVNELTPHERSLLLRFVASPGDTSASGAIERINDEVTLTGTQEAIFTDLRNGLTSVGYDHRIIDYTMPMLENPEANRLWQKSILSSWYMDGTISHDNREVEFIDDAYAISAYNGNSLAAAGWTPTRHGFFFSRTSVSPATGGDEWDCGFSGINGRTNTGNDGAWFTSGGNDLSQGSPQSENPAGIYYFSRAGSRMTIYFYDGNEVETLATTQTANNPLPINDDLFALGAKSSTGTGASFAGFTNSTYNALGFTLPIADAAEDLAMAQAILPLFWTAQEDFAAT